MNLDTMNEVQLVQRKEMAEILLGVETRNRYELRDVDGQVVGFAAEQGAGFWAFLARMFMGHWRAFDLHVFDAARALVLRAHHPFRWFFQRLEVFDAQGQFLGALQQRWAFFTKRFDVQDANGQVVLEMSSGLFKIWTFPFLRNGTEVARIEKKWSGFLSEAFTDADKFRVVFLGPVSPVERRLLVAAGLFVDLQYFERQAKNG
jgi:uncharacterized protein YxjI